MQEKPAACEACGNPEPDVVMYCAFCDSTKCEDCDMGNDVECPACPEAEDED